MAPKVSAVKRGLKRKGTLAPPKARASSRSSSFAECPVCQTQVAISLINLHLDLDCKPGTSAQQKNADAQQKEVENADESCVPASAGHNVDERVSVKLAPPVQASSMNGYLLLEDFISCEEEEQLLFAMDMDKVNVWKPYSFTGLNRGKSYGMIMALGRRQNLAPKHEMPLLLQPVMERMRSLPVLSDFFPNEMNALEYRKQDDHFLKAHVDDRQLSGTRIVNLSLCGDCFMTFKRERGAYECYKIKLKRRSLQILTGDSRYNFTHQIDNQNLLSPRRVSITFREVILVKS